MTNLTTFLKKNAEKILWVMVIIAIFVLGYYLRAYLALNSALALSPYEAFKLGRFGSDIFSDKLLAYPLGLGAERIINPLLGNFYLIYIWGGIIIFLLGKRISGSNLGGLLAFFLFAVSPDNLLQYTGRIYASGLNYVAGWTALLFFLNYLENKKNLNLLFFILFGIIALVSYHTGAAAFMVIALGLAAVHFFSQAIPDKKILTAFFALATIYGLLILIFDFNELEIISNALSNLIVSVQWQKIILIGAAGLAVTVAVVLIKNKKTPQWWLWAAAGAAAILIFCQTEIFRNLFFLIAPDYYVSTVTLNNYLAQIILIHIYFFLTAGEIFKKEIEPRNLFLRGWFWGLIIIFGGLLAENYYVRIIDFSAPLMFVLFGWYLSRKPKFWKTAAALTLLLMLISQIIIYRDPFTMRRYYTSAEINSAEKIIALNLGRGGVSDLRTAALFSHLGKKDINFFSADKKEYDLLFYDYSKIKDYQFSNLRTNSSSSASSSSAAAPQKYYVILSQSMKHILYSTNFATPPLTDEIFYYYDHNFKKLSDDGLMSVYLIHEN